MAVRGAADAGPRTVLSAAHTGGFRGKLLRDRWLRRTAADVHPCQLPRRPHLGTDVPSLCRDLEVHGPDLALHSDHRVPGRVFSGVSRPKPVARHLAVSGVYRAVLDVEYHPDDLLDSVARKGGARQLHAADD